MIRFPVIPGVLLAALALAAPADAALLGRLPATPGGTDYQAYYDDVLDVTWLADPEYGRVEDFGVSNIGLYTINGQPVAVYDWTTAHQWIAGMNAAHFLGASDWRLPRVSPVNGTAFNLAWSANGSTDFGYNVTAPGSAHPGSTASELAFMFYNTLGNHGYFAVNGTSSGTCLDPGLPDTCLLNKGPFTNLTSLLYWAESAPEAGGDPYWLFHFAFGSQEDTYPASLKSAWAVRDGDIGLLSAVVPVPAAAWLLGSALAALGGLARRAARHPSP